MTLDAFTIGEKYERWYPETTLEIIPRDDYGKLFPFIGGYNEEHNWMSSYVYGFCTADGKIVCDPAYLLVGRYEHEGREVYVALRATAERDSETGVGEKCLIAIDGSFISSYEEVYDGREGTLTVQKNGKWGSVDFSVKTLVPCMYEYPVFFGEGLAAVTEDFDAGYKYIDMKNNTVIDNLPPVPLFRVEQRMWITEDGAYDDLFRDLSFSCGLALYYEGDSYGYIDKAGQVIAMYRSDENWFRGTVFFEGYAVVQENGKFAVIDTDANIVIPFSKDDISMYWDDDEEEVIVALFTDSGVEYYSVSGNELIRKMEKAANHDDARHGFIFVREGPSGYNAMFKNGEEISLPNFQHYSVLNSDRAILHRWVYQESDLLIDGNGEILTGFGYSSEPHSYYSITVGQAEMLIYQDFSRQGLMTLDGEPITSLIFKTVVPFNDYCAVFGNGVGGLIDQNGEWIVRVALSENVD